MAARLLLFLFVFVFFVVVLQALESDDGIFLSGDARVGVVAKLVLAWSWLNPVKAEEFAGGLPLAADEAGDDGGGVDAESLERTAEVPHRRNPSPKTVSSLSLSLNTSAVVHARAPTFFQVPRSSRLRRLGLDTGATARADPKAAHAKAALAASQAAGDRAGSTQTPAVSRHPKRQAAYVATLVAQVLYYISY